MTLQMQRNFWRLNLNSDIARYCLLMISRITLRK